MRDRSCGETLEQRVSSPIATMGWVRSPRIPENKRVKNTSVGISFNYRAGGGKMFSER